MMQVQVQMVRRTSFYLGGIRLLHDHIWLAALTDVPLLKDLLQLKYMHRVRIGLSACQTVPRRRSQVEAMLNARTLMTRKMSADGYVMEKIAERASVDMAAWGVCGLSSPFI